MPGRIHHGGRGQRRVLGAACVGGDGARRPGVRHGGGERHRLCPDLRPARVQPLGAARRGSRRRPAAVKQLALGVRLRADAVFESFWPGLNGELLAAVRAPSTVPLWLWGASGSGKTHLLQAACAAAGESAAYFPLARPLALPPEALAGVERPRLLWIAGADAVAGDPAWERALFQLFNEAAELRTRLIFAAAGPPRQAPWSLDDWRSRAAS